MNAITQARRDLVADLKTGSGYATDPVPIPVFSTFPDRISPPCALVRPALSGYLEAGQFAGYLTVRLDVLLIVAKGDPETTVTALDDLTVTTLTNAGDWALTGVDAPALVSINGADYPAVTLHLARAIPI